MTEANQAMEYANSVLANGSFAQFGQKAIYDLCKALARLRAGVNHDRGSTLQSPITYNFITALVQKLVEFRGNVIEWNPNLQDIVSLETQCNAFQAMVNATTHVIPSVIRQRGHSDLSNA